MLINILSTKLGVLPGTILVGSVIQDWRKFEYIKLRNSAEKFCIHVLECHSWRSLRE